MIGYGDALMAAGLAETLYAQSPQRGPVCIVNRDGSPRWHPIWAGNPVIATKVRATSPTLVCGGGALPYIDYDRWQKGVRFAYSTTYRARDHRGHLYLTDAELDTGRAVQATYGQYLVLEPTPKDRKNVNRHWPIASWQQLASLLHARLDPSYTLVQCEHAHTTPLQHVTPITAPDFRTACAIFGRARLVVCLEGGVAFATAALGTPTVVLWGGCISAEVLSYPEQVNLLDDDPRTPCGAMTPCAHCVAVWHRLTPERVADAVIAALAPARLPNVSAPTRAVEVA